MRTVLPLVCLALLAVAGCGGGDEARSGSDPALVVVATTTQVSDLVRNVAGERAEVRGLLAANSDPHDYEPRPSDVRAIAESELVVRSGGDLDEWVGELVESAGGDREVVALINSVETIQGGGAHEEPDHAEEGHAEEAHAGDGDPHWWQNPRNAIAAVEAIRRHLTEADPEGAPVYSRNARAYVARLRALDEQIAACMERVPHEQRKLVTTHDALGYFAERYDIEVIGAAIPSLSTQAQPSAGETAALVRQIREENVNAVFAETGVNAKLEQAIADEAGAELGRPLWADTLGPPGSGGETYLQATAANAAALVEGFTGGAQSCRPRV